MSNRLTKLNAYGEAILIDASRSDSFESAIYKLYKYEKFDEMINDATYYTKQYEWLLDLNDESLAEEVINTNNVQNALIELLRLVDDITKIHNNIKL